MRAELLERYRALPLPTTRDEHWRFTDLAGFDPDAWTAEALDRRRASPSMLDLDVAATATIDEAGSASTARPRASASRRSRDDHPLLGTLVGRTTSSARTTRRSGSTGCSCTSPPGVELEKPLYLRVASGVPGGSLFWRVLVVAEPGVALHARRRS